MKLLLSLLLAAQLFSAQNALYIEGDLGASLSDEFNSENSKYLYDTGFSGALALGYQMDLWRVEAETLYLKNSISTLEGVNSYEASGDLIHQANLFNIYYSGYNSSKLVTSIGLGCGVSTLEMKDIKILNSKIEDSLSKDIFTYQASISVGYMHNQNIISGLKYRYIGMRDYDFNPKILNFYLRYLF